MALQRWAKYDLIVLDEVGYVPFAQVGGELLFQIISERAERATFVITTNLPFSEFGPKCCLTRDCARRSSIA